MRSSSSSSGSKTGWDVVSAVTAPMAAAWQQRQQETHTASATQDGSGDRGNGASAAQEHL
jgi:hypothetical protein